jgi:hypothetical protein
MNRTILIAIALVGGVPSFAQLKFFGHSDNRLPVQLEESLP